MKTETNQVKLLLTALLPKELFTHFELVNVLLSDDRVDVHLDEMNNVPDAFQNEKVVSKGFYPAKVIQDFPLRERAVFLHVRRRKWLIERTGSIVSTPWNITSEGTRYTKGFASFLKELFGQIPH